MTIGRSRPRRPVVLAIVMSLLVLLGLDAGAIVAAPAAHPTSGALPASLTPPQGLRVITWSGRQWLVFPNGQSGPQDGVPMTDSARAVYVDNKGRLHLKIIKEDGEWRSVQLLMLGPITYGRYQWAVDGSTQKFDKAVVLGLFTYTPSSPKFHDELDIEDSNFNHYLRHNDAQYVVQPYYGNHGSHYCTYRLPKHLSHSVQEMNWTPRHATFDTRRGGPTGPRVRFRCTPPGLSHTAHLRQFSYTGSQVPDASQKHSTLNINLWTDDDSSPTHGRHSIILDSLHVTPMSGTG